MLAGCIISGVHARKTTHNAFKAFHFVLMLRKVVEYILGRGIAQPSNVRHIKASQRSKWIWVPFACISDSWS
jgi:hypothetical protein